MSKYLYGASVQGIQEFIFATNKLTEIVGASKIVESIESKFRKKSGYIEGDEHILINAAGNIKAIFDDRESCQGFVSEFPKEIMQGGYGITISQAVVKMENEFEDQSTAINELEKRLKIQRNKPTIPLDYYISIMKQNPKTARAATTKDGDESLDVASKKKRDAYTEWFQSERKKDKNFSELKDIGVLSNKKNKIAVIHADGNGLGQLIPNLKMPLSEFSVKLNNATKKAFKDAKIENAKIREVVLGGDDLTMICDADIALEFTKRFLENFEKETQVFIDGGLTACAGIAYCNEKYPFHYAVDLAEELCSQTKKHAKKINPDLAPSSLMFHNIQSSNYQSWEKFVKDELTIQNDTQTIRCDFGPYYLKQEKQPLIENLKRSVEAYRCDGSPISRLRNWMGELHKSSTYADNMLNRINEVTSQSGKWSCKIMDKNLENLYSGLSDNVLILPKDKEMSSDGTEKNLEKTPIYDILQLHSATHPMEAK